MFTRIKTQRSISQRIHQVFVRNNWENSLFLSLFLNSLLLLPASGQTVVGTITRPGLASAELVVYETGNKLCVFDDRTNHLLLYDGASLTLKKEITFSKPVSDPFSCSGMAVNEPEGKLYVCLGYENWPEKWVIIEIVDLEGDSILTEIPITALLPQSANGITFDHESNKIFVAQWPAGLFIVDLNTKNVTKIDIMGEHMMLNPLTHEVFLSSQFSTQIGILNCMTNQVAYIDAVKAVDMTVNWLENKIYIISIPYAVWIYDRNDGSIKTIIPILDSERLDFNPGSNLVYTSAEIGCISSIIDGKFDSFFNLPMEGGAPVMGFRHATKHAYFVGDHFIAVLDEATQMFEKMDFDHPHAEMRSGIQHIAVNQNTGRVFVTSVMLYDPPDDNPIWVLQDSEMMTRPNVLLGGDLVTVLDPENHAIQDYWGVVTETGWGHETVEGMTYNPDGSRAYVVSHSTYYNDATAFLSAHAGSGAWDIMGYSAGNENAQVGSCDMSHQAPITPVVSADGSKIYVTCSATNLVRTVDVAVDSNLFVINEITVGKKPWGAALTPDGAQLYVANQGSNTVSIINTASSTVTTSITVGAAPWGLAINPSGTLAYVANSGSDAVSVINTATNKLITNIPVGSKPHWPSLTPDGKFLYVANNNSASVSVIDAGTQQVVRTISVGSHPEEIGFYPDGSRAYVATDSGASIINTLNFSVGLFRDLMKNPFGEIYGPYHSAAVANPSARFAGRITDHKGMPIVNASVRAMQEGVEKGTAATNTAGDFCIFYLQKGIYDLELTGPGFPDQYLMAQRVDAGQTKVVIFVGPTGVKALVDTPMRFSLSHNYPNPFNLSTIIRYSLPHDAQVKLEIYNTLGRLVMILVDERQQMGLHQAVFQSVDLASGIYFYRLQAGPDLAKRKMLLIR